MATASPQMPSEPSPIHKYHLTRHPNGTWYAYAHYYHGGKRQTFRRSCKTKDKTRAVRERSRLNALAKKGQDPLTLKRQGAPTGSRLVRHVVGDYLEYCKHQTRPGTHRSHCDYVNKHFGPLMDTPAHLLNSQQIERWQAGILKTGVKKSTVNRILVILIAALNRAKRHREISEIPYIQKFKLEEDTPRWFTDEEARALLTVSEELGRETALFVRLGLLCGLRPGEALALRCCDVDRDTGFLHIRPHEDDGFAPKTNTIRSIQVVSSLWPYLEHQASGRYFPRRNNPALPRGDFRKPWQALMAAAAIDPPATPYALRHTFGTSLARPKPDGTPSCRAPEIQKLMGHSSIRMSERYIHLTDDDPRLKRAVEGVAALLGM